MPRPEVLYNGDTDGFGRDRYRLGFFLEENRSVPCGNVRRLFVVGVLFFIAFQERDFKLSRACKRVMSDILSYLTETFRKVRKKPALMNTLPDFSADIWGETVYWVEVVHAPAFVRSRRPLC